MHRRNVVRSTQHFALATAPAATELAAHAHAHARTHAPILRLEGVHSLFLLPAHSVAALVAGLPRAATGSSSEHARLHLRIYASPPWAAHRSSRSRPHPLSHPARARALGSCLAAESSRTSSRRSNPAAQRPVDSRSLAASLPGQTRQRAAEGPDLWRFANFCYGLCDESCSCFPGVCTRNQTHTFNTDTSPPHSTHTRHHTPHTTHHKATPRHAQALGCSHPGPPPPTQSES